MVKRAVILTLFLLGFAFSSEFVTLNFNAKNANSKTLLVKAINLSLDEINARVAFINEFSNEPFFYSLNLWRDKSLDLNKIYANFIKHGIKISNIAKSPDVFDFTLDAKNLKIAILEPKFNEPVVLDRANSSYFINLNNATKLTITPTQSSEWLSLIRLYDDNLNQIELIQKDSPVARLELDLRGASYALISDSIDINNIKGGLTLNFKKE